MSARVHNTTQRATTGDRKVVFKSVLDSPFKIPWPRIPLNVQNAALASLVTILAGVAEYHIARQAASRKRKHARHDKIRKEKANARKKRKVGDDLATQANVEGTCTGEEDETGAETVRMDTDAEPDAEHELPPAPPIFSHLTFGINEVTKRLESQSHSLRLRTSVSTSSSSVAGPSAPDPKPLTHVFVCRADIDPPLLIAHLPDLVAACNIPSPTRNNTVVHLISLPANAEQALADALGLRRVSVLAFDANTPSLDILSALLASVQPPSAPWLSASTVSHIPTHIKQLRTTAPRDFHASKRARTEGRHAAKERNKNKLGSEKHRKGKQKEKKRIKITASGPTPSEDLLPT